MEELPIPLSRVELYLAKAAGMDVTPPEPKSRLELFLAKIAGMDVETPLPLSLKEQWLSCVYYGTTSDHPMLEGAYYIDNQKVDVRYLAVASGVPGATLPAKPQNRKEQYWAMIAIHGPIHGVLKYVTGTNITLTDVVSGIEELQFVYGDAYQQTYSGKNLLKLTDNVTHGVSGTVNSDGTVTISGLADSTGGYVVVGSDQDWKAGTYTATISKALPFLINYAVAGGVSFRFPAGTTSVTTTLGQDYSNVGSLFMSMTSGVTYNETFNIQIVAGSTPDYDFEPYTGGIPAPNPDYPQEVQVVTGEQTVTVTGKNLWGMTNIIGRNNVTITKSGNEYELYWTGGFNAALSTASGLDSNKNYSLTFKHKGEAISLRKVGTSSSLVQTNQDQDYTTYTYSFNSESSLSLEFIRRTSTSNVSAFVKDFQIEEGSTATAYEPYQSQSYTISLGSIELCKIGDYQDYIYKSGDDWYVHKEIGSEILDGTRAWSINQTGTQNFFYSTYLTIDSANTSTMLLSNYGRAGDIRTSTTVNGIAIFNQTQLRIRYGQEMPIADWKSKLTSNNMIVYTFLATSTDTKVTNATLVGQLEALDSAVLPKPIAHITVGATDSNLPSPLKISYYGRGA